MYIYIYIYNIYTHIYIYTYTHKVNVVDYIKAKKGNANGNFLESQCPPLRSRSIVYYILYINC